MRGCDVQHAKFTDEVHSFAEFMRPNGIVVHSALLPVAGGIRIEYDASGGVVDPYEPPPPPVPTSISDRQFFQQLPTDGVISEAEALLRLAGSRPPCWR
ncbi:hypothetical protein X566_17985 [Afipia sp. P52-10]|nr:hypothetical protein X566_17985 [Afipia sp. P52-10]